MGNITLNSNGRPSFNYWAVIGENINAQAKNKNIDEIR